MHEKPFKAAWWLFNAHLQTLWPTLCRRPIKTLKVKRERLELTDGDFIDLDWVGQGSGPIVIILHGLEGSVASPYAKGMLVAIKKAGWRGVFMHFRGCSEEQNRLPRLYHSGDTHDVATLVAHLQKRESNTPLAAIGFSLGGNVLLKWLGETGSTNPLTAATAICVPFELNKAVDRINVGFSRVYERHILSLLRKKIIQKCQQFILPISLPLLSRVHSLREFDDKITAPLHGFHNADDYYQKASSRSFLSGIRVPTLIIHSEDDPFMTPDLLPCAHELSSEVQLELTKQGGHVGYVMGNNPWRAYYWLEHRVPSYLMKYLNGFKNKEGQERNEKSSIP